MVANRRHLSAPFVRFREVRWLAVPSMVLGVCGYWVRKTFGDGPLVPEGPHFVGAVPVSLVEAGAAYLVTRHQQFGGPVQERAGGERRVD
jgi:hypothetical protein